MGLFLLIVGLVLFSLLIITHELGHFWAARRGGVDVEEFGIFFPPALYKRKMKGGWTFKINLLPIGGYVKLKGEHDSDSGPGTYGGAKTWTKVKIMLAGVVVNLLTAVVVFTVLALFGMPKLIDNQFTVASDTKVTQSKVLISYIEPGSPAAKAGLKTRDELVSIGPSSDQRKITSSDVLPTVTQRYPGERVNVTYIRDKQTRTAEATLRTKAAVDASIKANDQKGYLGIQPTELTTQRSTWSAPIVGIGLSAQFTALTFQGLGHALAGVGGIFAGLFTGNHVARENAQTTASSQVSGPVGIFAVLQAGSSLGFQYVLIIIGLIALTLGIMNALPLPPLDGGHLLVMVIARLRKKPIRPGVEEAIYGISYLVFILLAVLLTVIDVKRFY